ncbi:AsmA family protein [Polluticaenibacter yanchengensis]|uniref:AsmA family protein n=1 Tax=Polluticaenibacter yanchengensis TaxID=3014562 RepID=A0ABT4UH59_9BACT|nr:AsmA family protein [Chitinophagaceae bacterium LY-5]
MRKLKKILKVSGIVLLVIAFILFIIPIVLKSTITSTVKAELENNLYAKVELDGVTVSAFKKFPYIYVGLENITVKGVDIFKDDTLVWAKDANAQLGWGFVFGDTNTVIKMVNINGARVNALKLADGKANWEIEKPAIEKPKKIRKHKYIVTLEYYKVKDIDIRYKDEKDSTNFEYKGFSYEGRGDFAAEKFLIEQFTKPKKKKEND